MSNIVNDIQTAPQTFTNWNACMSKTYCKWPVIAGIIVGAVIIVSILWCIASCLCCGASLCGSCVRCITCFGCCGACRNGSRRGSRRHKDDYSQMPPTPYNGYQPQPAPMSYAQQFPQYAQFDAGTKSPRVHEDSLMPMPTWDTSTSRRVEDHSQSAQGHSDPVEMSNMGPPARTHRGGYSQVPLNAPASPSSTPYNQGYFENQAYSHNSDIGAQRMPNSSNVYSGPSSRSRSPAPTYATNPPPQHHTHSVAAATDRFASGAMSPTPREYGQQSQQPQHYQSTRKQAVYSPSASTRYEASDYNSYQSQSISPPAEGQQYLSSGYDQGQSSQGVRPPSLLQIGRKPVVGSHREV